MNEEKIKEIVEKVLADNMPNKDEITKKVIEAVKEAEKKENDKPWLIKKGEEYWSGDSDDERFWNTHTNNCTENDKAWNLVGLVARTKDELREIIKARKMQREYEQWCMEYPVDWTNSDEAYRQMGFDYVSKFPIIFKGFFILSHAPMQLNETTPYFNYYGHVHNDNKYQDTETSRCVSVEKIGYKPVLMFDDEENKEV